MLKRKLCEIVFDWNLSCEGPLLIADGRYSQEPVRDPSRKGWYPDKFFINRIALNEMKSIIFNAGSTPPNLGLNFYVPGTSIRGPFRAQAERIIRTLLPGDAPPHLTACDPFEQDKEHHSQTLGCSNRLEGKERIYASACPACKLFGCAGLASRIIFKDADITNQDEYRSVYRDMIGIDRFTGGVHQKSGGGGGANMRLHVLEHTKFSTKISVVNFELWQLGLLAYVFNDFFEGIVPIGYGKTKGFGLIKGNLTKITLKYPLNKTDGNTIDHLGSLTSNAAEVEYYNLDSTPGPEFEMTKINGAEFSFYDAFEIKGPRISGFFNVVARIFNNYMDKLNNMIEEKKEWVL